MKKVVVLILLLAAVAAGAYALPLLRGKKEHSNEIILYGNVDIRDVSLGFRVSGRIAELRHEEGDRVKQGVLLALLDAEPFEQELALRRAELAESLAVLNNAEKLYERRKKLVGSGAVSQGAHDDAQAAWEEARARVETAKARLSLARIRLEDTRISAPDAGTILTRIKEPGSVISEGTSVYTLALDNPVWVRAYIDEPRLGRIHPGQKALVATDSGGRYQGQVGFISPQAEFTPKNVETTQLRTDLVYRLRIIVNAPDNGLRQGMPVTVTLEP